MIHITSSSRQTNNIMASVTSLLLLFAVTFPIIQAISITMHPRRFSNKKPQERPKAQIPDLQVVLRKIQEPCLPLGSLDERI